MQEEVIYHHGIKGMKWGVRRYQNYDGSYTKRGLERYNKAMDDYESAKSKAEKAKNDYKSGTGTKQQYKSAKKQVSVKKEKVSNAYDKLKTDKLADEGKTLYKKGKTITGNTNLSVAVATGSTVAAGIVSRYLAASGNYRLSAISGSAIAAGGTAVGAILGIKNYRENKRLRAYYAH